MYFILSFVLTISLFNSVYWYRKYNNLYESFQILINSHMKLSNSIYQIVDEKIAEKRKV